MKALPHHISVLLSLAVTGCVGSASNPVTTDDSGTPDATQGSADAGSEGGMDGGGAHDGSADASTDGAVDVAVGPSDGASSCPPAPQDAGTYGNTVLADKPLAYWRFDETAGPTAHDSSGNCVDGTYKGPVTYGTTGALWNNADTAVTLNGAGAYVDMGDVFSFLNLGPFSLELWVKPSVITTEYRGLITKEWEPADQSDREGYVLFQMVTAGTGFERYQAFISEGAYCGPDGGAPDSGGCSESGAWVHVVATFDGGNMNLYQNGVLVAGPTYSPQLIQGTPGCSFVVGALECGSIGYFSGEVDEVAVYGAALSQARVQAHYLAGHQ
jgi:hypothetical protein